MTIETVPLAGHLLALLLARQTVTIGGKKFRLSSTGRTILWNRVMYKADGTPVKWTPYCTSIAWLKMLGENATETDRKRILKNFAELMEAQK